MTTYPGQFRDVISSADNPEGWLLASAPSGVDSNAGVFPGALASDAMKVYARPADKFRHELILKCAGNTAAASAIFDIYALAALPAAFTADDYRSAGAKVVDNLQVTRLNSTDATQPTWESAAPYFAVVARSVAVAPTNGTCKVIILSR